MKSYLKCGAKNKFYVFKIEDVIATQNKTLISKITKDIYIERYNMGKNLNNEYIVINTDEKYFWIIKLILKMFNHWG